MVKAIVFDCFGVLVNEWLTELARSYPKESQQQLWDAVKALNLGFIPAKEGIRQMATALQISESTLLQERTTQERRNEPLLAYIKQLRERGYKIAVLSNVSAGGIARRFSEQERAALFDAIVESGSIGIAKPDKNAYDYTCSQLQLLPSECIMIDDREDFCAGAEAAGMQSIWYVDFVTLKQQLDKILNI